MSLACSRAELRLVTPLLPSTWFWRGLRADGDRGWTNDDKDCAEKARAQQQLLPNHVHRREYTPNESRNLDSRAKDWANLGAIQQGHRKLPWPRNIAILPGDYSDTRHICDVALHGSFVKNASKDVAATLLKAMRYALSLIADPHPPGILPYRTRRFKAQLMESLDSRLPQAFASIVQAVQGLACSSELPHSERMRKATAVKALAEAGGVNNKSMLSAALRTDEELAGTIKDLVDQTIRAAATSTPKHISHTFTDVAKALLIFRQYPALSPAITSAEACFEDLMSSSRIAGLDLAAIAATLKLVLVTHVGANKGAIKQPFKHGKWRKSRLAVQSLPTAKVRHLANAAQKLLATPEACRANHVMSIAHSLALSGLQLSLTLVTLLQSHVRVIHTERGYPSVDVKDAIEWLDAQHLLGLEADVVPTQMMIGEMLQPGFSTLSEAVRLVEAALHLGVPVSGFVRQKFWNLVDVHNFYGQLGATDAADIVQLANKSHLAPIPDHVLAFSEFIAVAAMNDS